MNIRRTGGPTRTLGTDLEVRVESARDRVARQDDAALVEALSDRELDAERALAEWTRDQDRDQRRKRIAEQVRLADDDRKAEAVQRRREAAEGRWHERAVAEHRRATNPQAELTQLYRTRTWSTRACVVMVMISMCWSAVNVQHNLVPGGNMADPLYWLSYLLESTISLAVIVSMSYATRAAARGVEFNHRAVLGFEIGMLSLSFLLNTGPHLVREDWGKAGQYGLAPIMLAVAIWLHSFTAAGYGRMIHAAAEAAKAADPDTAPRTGMPVVEVGEPITPIDIERIVADRVAQLRDAQAPAAIEADRDDARISTGEIERIVDEYVDRMRAPAPAPRRDEEVARTLTLVTTTTTQTVEWGEIAEKIAGRRDPAVVAEILRMRYEDKLEPATIVEETSHGRDTVYRVLRRAEESGLPELEPAGGTVNALTVDTTA